MKPNASGSRGNAASRWALRTEAKASAKRNRRKQDKAAIREQR